MDKSKVKHELDPKQRENLFRRSRIPKSDSKILNKSETSLNLVSIRNDFKFNQDSINSKLMKIRKNSNDSTSKIKRFPDLLKKNSLNLEEKLVLNKINQASFIESQSGINPKALTLKRTEEANSKEKNVKKLQEQVARVTPMQRVSNKFDIKHEASTSQVVKSVGKKINSTNDNQNKKKQKLVDNKIYKSSNFWKHNNRSSIGNYLEDKYSYSDTECLKRIEDVDKRFDFGRSKNHISKLDNQASISQIDLICKPLSELIKGPSLPCSSPKLTSLLEDNLTQVKGSPHEVSDLKQELLKAKSHIDSLNFKLSSNLHTMTNFENSLSCLKLKVEQVAMESEQKDLEIESLNQIIQNLKKESFIKEETMLENQTVFEQKQPNWFKDQVNRVFKINRNRFSKDAESQLIKLSNQLPNNITHSAPSTPKLTVKKFDPLISDINEIRKQLIDKEKLLTDIRLDLLSAENQIEDLREDTNQLSKELNVIREENQKLQHMLDKSSTYSSNSSINNLTIDSTAGYSKRIFLTINQIPISCFTILTTTTWSQLDSIVIKKFNHYLDLIDFKFRLGLSESDLNYYETGKEKIRRNFFSSLISNQTPEMLPFGYLIEDNFIKIEFSSKLAHLTLECNLSKTIMSEMICSVKKNQRIALIGQNGVGKSYVASKVAHFINDHSLGKKAQSQDKDQKVDIIDISSKSEEELKSYFYRLTQFKLDSTIPNIVILENIQNISSLNVFSSLCEIPSSDLPFIIATGTESVSNQILEYFHNQLRFEIIDWINLIINYDIIISRCLKKKLILKEMKSLLNEKVFDLQLTNEIIKWIPQVWNKVNVVLKNSNSKTISIEKFLNCPIDFYQSQLWFVNIWKSLIDPLLNNIRLNQFKLKNEFIEWIHQTYPWGHEDHSLISMLNLNQIKDQSDSLLQTLTKLKLLSQFNLNGDKDYI